MAQTSWVGPVAAQPKWLGLVQPNKKKEREGYWATNRPNLTELGYTRFSPA